MRFVCAAKAKWVMDLLPKINTVRRLRPKPRAARAAPGPAPQHPTRQPTSPGQSPGTGDGGERGRGMHVRIRLLVNEAQVVKAD